MPKWKGPPDRCDSSIVLAVGSGLLTPDALLRREFHSLSRAALAAGVFIASVTRMGTWIMQHMFEGVYPLCCNSIRMGI